MASFLFVLCTLLPAGRIEAAQRALLIAIDDYTASRLGPAVPIHDDLRNLTGAVNDLVTLKEMLPQLYGVDPRAIVTLTDQEATRAAILRSVEQLEASAAKDDDILFYFAGHGSQRFNSLSDEHDQLDEAIVPADSRAGAPDIRDKELRRLFNRILDRGARLTVILDSCHSGSGARGLATGARSRGVKPDMRDVRDGNDYGPRPEERGALVISATEDTGEAHEVRTIEGKKRGVFSWAWIRSLRDASSGEPAVETFYRAQARMRAESPYQSPVIAGTPAAKLAPFLGARVDQRHDRTVVAVGRVDGDSVILQGGWANGLAAGTELRDRQSPSRVVITAMRGLGQSVARVVSGPPPKTGALMEVAGWAVPPGVPLRVCVPRAARSITSLTALAKTLYAKAKQRGIRRVANPLDQTPTHTLRWNGGAWEIVLRGGAIQHVGNDDQAIAAVAGMPAAASLFIQFPTPAEMADAIESDSVAADDADYILAGRYSRGRLQYAWLRPMVERRDRRQTALRLQTRWTTSAPDLRKALMGLRRIQSWLTLESPPRGRFPYRLQIRRTDDERLVGEGDGITSDTSYKLHLRGIVPMPAEVERRYVYCFVVDGNGRSELLFPPRNAGSVENRLPDSGAPMDIALEGSAFRATEPFGIDTYFLLSTDEPLPDPSVLEWDGVRAPQQWQKILGQGNWSLERVSYESVRARATKSAP